MSALADAPTLFDQLAESPAVREPVRSERSGQTLADLVEGLWHEVTERGVAICPLCGGELRPVQSTCACASCGAELS